MSTSKRLYVIMSFESKLARGNFFAIVVNHKRTRSVHETGLYCSRYYARHAAEEWASKSQSKLARSLNASEG